MNTLPQVISSSEGALSHFSLKILKIGGQLQYLIKALKVHLKGWRFSLDKQTKAEQISPKLSPA